MVYSNAFQRSSMTVADPLPNQCANSAIRLWLKADIELDFPLPAPQTSFVLWSSSHRAETGRRARPQARTGVRMSPISIAPHSGFGKRTRAVTMRSAGHSTKLSQFVRSAAKVSRLASDTIAMLRG